MSEEEEIHNTSYDELLRKFVENEEELNASNSKLELSEEEIIKLKNHIKESKDHLDNARKELRKKEDDLEYKKGQTTDLETHVPDCSHKIAKLKIQIEESRDQLDNLQKELKIKEEDLEKEKGQVLELQKETANLENQFLDCSEKIAKLTEQLEVAREQVKVSNNEKTWFIEESERRRSLNNEMADKFKETKSIAMKNDSTVGQLIGSVSKRKKELHEWIANYIARKTKGDCEWKNMEFEKNQLISDVRNKSKLLNKKESRLKEWNVQREAFEEKLEQCEAVKLNLEKLNASEQMELQDQISSLKEELEQRRHDAETVNKEFDKHKKKYSKQVTKNDRANAKIDKLMAEVSSGDNQIADMKRELLQLQAQQEELISGNKARLSLANKLKLKVEELENEVTRQNAAISDTGEEKREAIRQLCISLEHYWSECRRLRSGYYASCFFSG